MVDARSLFPLQAPVRPYDWGSTTAIPELLGTPPTGAPQAEMWFGAHPGAPAVVTGAGLDAGPQALDAFLSEHPDLAGRTAGGRLPFLMKLLAAAKPLSLQVHPNREQAERGFAREEAAGLPASDPTRSYKDPNHKPEMIVAISPFLALSGFRHPAEARRDLAALLGDSAETEPAIRLIAALDRPEPAEALSAALVAALNPHTGMENVSRVVVDAARRGPLTPATEVVRIAADAFGAEPGILVALMLNRVDLLPAQALYLEAGTMHAYLCGIGLEAMATSDNVLRGGLTTKHIDLDELLHIVRFVPAEPLRIEPATTTESGVRMSSYDPPVPDFAVHLLDCENGSRELEAITGPATLVVTEGALSFGCGEDHVTVQRGESLFKAAGKPLRITGGSGRAYLTTVHA